MKMKDIDNTTIELPDGWQMLSIGECLEFKNGLNKEKSFFGRGTPIVNYMDVYKHRGIINQDVAGKVAVSNDEKSNFGIKKGDVFFTRTSETVEEIGVASVLLEDVPNGVFSGFLLRGRPKNDLLDDTFKKYCFHSSFVRKEITSKAHIQLEL
jgi:type I restriction enzyme S subunit